MKVHIHVPKTIKFTLPVPYALGTLCLNKKVLNIAQKHSDKKFEVTDETIREIKKFLKKCKEYKGLTIVDIKSSDGVKVKITL